MRAFRRWFGSGSATWGAEASRRGIQDRVGQPLVSGLIAIGVAIAEFVATWNAKANRGWAPLRTILTCALVVAISVVAGVPGIWVGDAVRAR